MDIYLDQNHFIALAKAFHGRNSSPALDRVASLATQAVQSGRLRLPLSRLHLLEATKIADDARRQRLIEAFLAFSGGWVVKPVEVLTAEELLKWAAGESARTDTAVRRGLLAAYSSYEVAAARLGVKVADVEKEDVLGDSPEAWNFALTQPGFRAHAANVDASANAYAARVDSVRGPWSKLPASKRATIFAEGLLQDTIKSLEPLTPELHLAIDLLGSRPSVELAAAFADIPTLDVLYTLSEAKTRDLSRATDPNDLWDLGFLAAAIPYFDVVVTERYWAHLAKATGVAVRHACQVLAKTEDLTPYLE